MAPSIAPPGRACWPNAGGSAAARPTGEARITGGHRLPARHVIHTVGPIWRGAGDEDALLVSCYRNAFALARAHGLASIAFPAISTGAYGFPPERAARIAAAQTRRHGAGFARILFACFDASSEAHCRAAFAASDRLL